MTAEIVRYAVNENALQLTAEQRDQARKVELEAKVSRGERWTPDERIEWWRIHGLELALQVDEAVRAKNTAFGISAVIGEFAKVAIQQTLARERLEDRVAELERAAKPRLRLAAPTRKRA